MVGMARAKKAKVEKVEALLTKAPVTEAVTMAAGDDLLSSNLEPQEPAAAALVASDEMAGAEARLELNDLIDAARKQMRGWQKMAREAESEFHLQ